MFLNNAELAKKSFLNFIFNFFIAFMSFVTLKKKKKEKHQVSFPSKRTEFYTWKSDIHFVLEGYANPGTKMAVQSVFFRKPGFCLKEQSLKV